MVGSHVRSTTIHIGCWQICQRKSRSNLLNLCFENAANTIYSTTEAAAAAAAVSNPTQNNNKHLHTHTKYVN